MTEKLTHDYWLIERAENGMISMSRIDRTSIEGYKYRSGEEWLKSPGYRDQGFKVYRFEDARNNTITTVVIASYRECFRFASQCYDDIKGGKWKTIRIDLK